MVLGLDVGSMYTKGVLFEKQVINKAVVKTAFKPKQAIKEIKNILSGFDKIVATGYGRELVEDAYRVVTEVSAFARGSIYFNPETRTIIDVGGQDSKVIRVKNGKVIRFVMNDRCAAGTGNFIEKIAQALNLSFDEFGGLALKSERPEMIDSLCVVMAETEILSLVQEGKRLEDIILGVCDSVIRRIIGIAGQIGIEEPILFCGGGALNPGLAKALKRYYPEIIIPEEPQFVGAIGAAMMLET
jgi:predicted CoA-substrate-specific enzyme activase|uniref:ATPase BadF/BadG/BcrA/BcrD type domain-containing protein n=1 Tax=candidate division WOR-3 bacterium TaxID=2052148 RepID=A0A7V3RHG5_UNCW3